MIMSKAVNTLEVNTIELYLGCVMPWGQHFGYLQPQRAISIALDSYEDQHFVLIHLKAISS